MLALALMNLAAGVAALLRSLLALDVELPGAAGAGEPDNRLTGRRLDRSAAVDVVVGLAVPTRTAVHDRVSQPRLVADERGQELVLVGALDDGDLLDDPLGVLLGALAHGFAPG